MRRLIFLICLAAAIPARAEEPLMIRIRANPSLADEFGGSGPSAAPQDETARQAFLAREAVWERSNRRARIAIASVCTGCLKENPVNPDSIQDTPRQGQPPAEIGR